MDQPQILIFIALALMVLMLAAFVAFFVGIFQHWLRALLAGVQVSVLDVLLMRFRRVPVHQVVDSLILARHSNIDLTCEELQVAALKGADVKKLTLALIEARRRGLDLTFAEIVEHELRGMLAALLAEEADNQPVASED